MKILDRYIARSFLIGYAISFLVLIGLRMLIDLFVNLDEFAINADRGWETMVKNIVTYYGFNVTLYFRDISGVIIVVAAAFSLGKMVRCNELIAMIASGVSAKRIVTPILVLAILFTGLSIANQELLIPSISDRLSRRASETNKRKAYAIWFLTDTNGSLICSQLYDAQTQTFHHPAIIKRRLVPAEESQAGALVSGQNRSSEASRIEVRDDKVASDITSAVQRPMLQASQSPDTGSLVSGVWEVTGRITADLATYNDATGEWDLVNGLYVSTDSMAQPQPVASYRAADLLPREIAIRRKSGYNTLLSSRQLAALARQQTKMKDTAQLLSQKHFRITDPIIQLTMLLVSLPVLICRDPRTMKSAVLVSFVLTAACNLCLFLCKLFSTEPALFGRVMPEFWAWLPVFIFLPIAFIELDSMKT